MLTACRWRSYFIRFVTTWTMIFLFFGIVYIGHFALVVLVRLCVPVCLCAVCQSVGAIFHIGRFALVVLVRRCFFFLLHLDCALDVS
jgi:hypothetical protein